MKGFVPTPTPVVDLMVEKLFRARPPTAESSLLDPGCGRGAFIDGIVRWCERHGSPLPEIVGIESNPEHVAAAADRFRTHEQIQIRHADFLRPSLALNVSARFDYIIGNPPYVPITALTTREREAYRSAYGTAKGRFDLYLLFYEQALQLLSPGGRLVFITPEKFLYVETARPLRELLRRLRVDELHFLDEGSFGDLVTYPLVTTLTGSAPSSEPTHVVHRNGRTARVHVHELSTVSWLPAILGADEEPVDLTLGEICTRVSCGVATGADAVFVMRNDDLDAELKSFAHPTIAGRQIARGEPLDPRHSLLVPYAQDGRLLPERELGHLGRYLSEDGRRARLLKRTCVKRKPWYAFHENPPMTELLRPKLLCKDITRSPFFVPDREGDIIPRHSVYYLVPRDPECLDDLARYLNSAPAREWLQDHCQRAAKGYLRLQSHVLKRLPLPESFVELRRSPGDDVQLEARLA